MRPDDRFCFACGASLTAPPVPHRRGLARLVWGDAIRTYGRHLHHLLPSALAAEAISVAFQIAWYAMIGRSPWLLVFLGPGAFYLVYFVLAGVHVREIEETREGHHDWNVLHTIREVRPQLPLLFGLGVAVWVLIDLVYLAIVLLGVGAPWWIGLPLLVGFLAALYWFMTRSSCVSQVIVLEELRPLPAFRRSWQLTKGRFWRLLGIVFVSATATAIVGLVLEDVVLPYAYGSSPDLEALTELGPHSAGSYFAAVLSEALTVPFGLLVGVFMYLHLRERVELAALPAPEPAPSPA